MRRQLRGKIFMVRRVHEYQVKGCGAFIDIGSDIRLDDDRALLRPDGLDVSLDDLDAFLRFLNKGDLGRTPAYGLNPEAATSCKKIQDNRILKVMDQC